MKPIRRNAAAVGAGDITRGRYPKQSSNIASPRTKESIRTKLLGLRKIIVLDKVVGDLASGLKEASSDWETTNVRF